MRVLALPRYGRRAASTRQRFLQYQPYLEDVGIELCCEPLLGDDHLLRLADGRRASFSASTAAYARRAWRLLNEADYEVLWVHCEVFPYLPGLFERAAFLPRKPVVYDFDDAFFHNYDDNSHGLVSRLLSGKLEPLLRGAVACFCGNPYLQGYASRFCDQSLIIPTVVDANIYRPAAHEERSPPVIGWIGSPSTWTYLRPHMPLLTELTRDSGAIVRVVGAPSNACPEPIRGIEFVEWSEEAEVALVQSMDIGIMPVSDDPWARGKSGYKLIQYMACGLPVVASPVGVNAVIAEHGVNGYLASTPDEWRAALESLICDSGLRRRMGQAGRQKAEEQYSLQIYGPKVAQLLRGAATGTLHEVRTAELG